MKTTALGHAALDYGRHGLWVFPCKPNGKQPLTPNGFKDATDDLTIIENWWRRFPTANIGLATGKINGIIVLDIDVDHKTGEPIGERSLQAYGLIPATCSQQTGGGGRQLFFRYPAGDQSVKCNQGQLGKGLDVRGDGGYVIVPPSIHPSGQMYGWVDQPIYSANLADCPTWISNSHASVTKTPDQLVTINTEEIRSALSFIDAVSYYNWITVGMALHSTCHPRAFSLWDEWSAKAPNYGQTENQWLRFQPDRGITLASLFNLAKSSGWNSDVTLQLTDSGFAERLACLHGDILRYQLERRQWLVFNNGVWRIDYNEVQSMSLTKSVSEALSKEALSAKATKRRSQLEHAAQIAQSKGSRKAMLELLRSEKQIAIHNCELDADPRLLNMANGTINLTTGKLLPHNREDFLTRQIDLQYDPASKCPRWIQFLNEIMNENQQMINYLQLAAGYSATGDVSEHCFFILFGSGANGKSVFLNTLQNVLGDYVTQAEPRLLEQRYGEVHPTGIADLFQARLAICMESGHGRQLDETLVKQLTGGDKIKARFMHRDFFEFRPTCKLWLATNSRPRINGTDDGIWRRVRLIPFTRTIEHGKQDRQLLEKLRAEYPGILRWIIQGAVLYSNHGLPHPQIIEATTSDYRVEMDTLGQFIADELVPVKGNTLTATQIYLAYRKWSSSRGEQPLTQKSLSMQLKDRGFESKKRGATLYIGWQLKHPQVRRNTRPQPYQKFTP